MTAAEYQNIRDAVVVYACLAEEMSKCLYFIGKYNFCVIIQRIADESVTRNSLVTDLSIVIALARGQDFLLWHQTMTGVTRRMICHVSVILNIIDDKVVVLRHR